MEILICVIAVLIVALTDVVCELIKARRKINKLTKPAPMPIGVPCSLKPLFVDWLYTNSGEYFRKSEVMALTKNPNGTMNVVLGNGYSINTMLSADEMMKVLGNPCSASIADELKNRNKIFDYGKEEKEDASVGTRMRKCEV